MSSFSDMSSGTSTPMAWIPLILLFDITCLPFNVIGDVGAGVNLGQCDAGTSFLPVSNPGNPYSPWTSSLRVMVHLLFR